MLLLTTHVTCYQDVLLRSEAQTTDATAPVCPTAMMAITSPLLGATVVVVAEGAPAEDFVHSTTSSTLT